MSVGVGEEYDNTHSPVCALGDNYDTRTVRVLCSAAIGDGLSCSYPYPLSLFAYSKVSTRVVKGQTFLIQVPWVFVS